MAMTAIVVAATMSASVLSSGQVQFFPGSYFDTRVRVPLQRTVMERWPGPGELLRMWREEELSEKQRLALLLGGAVHHDPMLLPTYREAIASDSQRLRQGAAYGFRDLLADLRPNVTGGVDDEAARKLGEEMDAVAQTLRQESLLALWLQAALANEGASLPGWQGVVLQRSSRSCFRAAERVAGVADLELLATAYRISRDRYNRIALMQLIEGVSLSRFVVKPSGEGKGWGPQIYTNGLNDLDSALRRWSRGGCSVDGEAVLRENLRKMGIEGVDPLAPEGCGLWRGVLARGLPAWWMLAARRLYACGGPWFELSTLDRDKERTRELRERMLAWYKPPRPKAPRPTRRPRPREGQERR
ncbi:MAG: hypothetical protein KAJ97_02660 [Acidobacteria bacterium]|nr:hypothetical protein [Acidobacteriota bacterium]